MDGTNGFMSGYGGATPMNSNVQYPMGGYPVQSMASPMAGYNQQMGYSQGYTTGYSPQTQYSHGDQPYSSPPAASMPNLGPKMGGPKRPPIKKAKRDPASFTLDLSKPMKSQLGEYCQLKQFPNPFYNTMPGDPNAVSTLTSGWKSVVTVNGIDYTDNKIETTKKLAEQRAAEACLRAIGLLAPDQEQIKSEVIPQPKPQQMFQSANQPKAAQPPQPVPVLGAAAEKSTPSGPSGKQRLHMFLTKMKLGPLPTYQVAETPNGFIATCSFQDHAIQGGHPVSNRKSAEHLAAEEAYSTLQKLYEDPGVQCVSAQEFTVKVMVPNPKARTSLNDYCLRRTLDNPKYTAEMMLIENRAAFKCVVEVNEKTYSTQEGTLYRNKKLAEQAAAEVAWSVLQLEDQKQKAEEESLKSAAYKSMLHEHLTRLDLEKPNFVFESVKGIGHMGKVTFEGKTFTSLKPFLDKKAGEQELARLALEGLGIKNLAKAMERRALKAKRVLTGGLSWKNALFAFCTKNEAKFPEIVIEQRKGLYHAVLKIEGSEYRSLEQGFNDDESAIQSACKACCIARGIPLHVPVTGATPMEVGDEKSKSTIELILDNASGEPVLVPSAAFKQALEEFNVAKSYWKRPITERQQQAYAIPKKLLTRLIVVEHWTDKKTVVVVGNGEFAIPLVCLPADQKCELKTKDGKTVTLEPGMVLHNIEAVAKWIPFCHSIGFVAFSCERISKVTQSDKPVVTGAGVVLLTKKDDSIQVLLKRYHSTIAFVPVAQELALSLKRAASPFLKRKDDDDAAPWKIDLEKVVSNIQQWSNEEIIALKKMTPDSVASLFKVTKWRWFERWNAILEGRTFTGLKEWIAENKKKRESLKAQGIKPEKDDAGDDDEEDEAAKTAPTLKNGTATDVDDGVPLREKFGFNELQAAAEAEFQRRQSLGDNEPQDIQLRPWGFPRGGFKHQALPFGLHMESIAECARRELKEECAVTLKLNEVENAAKVTVLRTDSDNLNPHKGDASIFYLHVVDSAGAAKAGKPIQDVMNIQNQTKPTMKRPWNTKPIQFKWHIMRQKDVCEEFTWFNLEDAADLCPLFSYIATTVEFSNFLKSLDPGVNSTSTAATPVSEVKVEAAPAKVQSPAPARGRGRGRRRY